MDSLQLINSKKEFSLLLLFISSIFLLNILYEYNKYKDLKEEELYYSKFQIINIYDKKEFYVLKLKRNDLLFFTSINKELKLNKLDFINLAIDTRAISFIDFLKGFYAKTLFIDNLSFENSFKKSLFDKINMQHETLKTKELFSALFLAIPISKENREIYTNFSISHLIAISGFHLGILAFISYWLIYYPYSFFHKRYFIYRNKKSDIVLLTIFILLFYLYLSDIVPSLLRSFIMFFLAFIFLRSNIKVLSFQSLFITFLIIISLFPKYLFSISLWFSLLGVFYIFLYLQYFKTLPKILSFIFFNFWIFFVFNPIVHFFFYNTSWEQLLSPFLTLVFTIFYPFELFLHLVSYGALLDSYILDLLEYKMSVYEVKTPILLFVVYIFVSFYSIINTYAFIVLNILLVLFNLYLYL